MSDELMVILNSTNEEFIEAMKKEKREVQEKILEVFRVQYGITEQIYKASTKELNEHPEKYTMEAKADELLVNLTTLMAVLESKSNILVELLKREDTEN